ncbi:MAG TPA: hypothetical protein VF397_12810 [Pyrinomonadaceae bacterium]
MQDIKGVQFVTDSVGHKVAVQLDLEQWGDLWEDIYDTIVARTRASESRMTLNDFEDELRTEGLLSE